jgi:hypothetical protein
LCLTFDILNESLDWGPLFNWGPWAAALKALALIWHWMENKNINEKL